MAKRETNAERAAIEDERRGTQLIAKVLGTIICKKGRLPGKLTKGKPKDRKREPNKERRAREAGRLFVLRHARIAAGTIRGLMKDKSPLAPKEMEHLPAKKLKSMGYNPNSKEVRSYYSDLGGLLCDYHGNVPEFLHLVVNILERKPPLPGPYDDKIKTAYEKAMLPVCVINDELVGGISFPQFKKVFWEQNPKLQGASDPSLRRSLRRLGLPIHSRRNRMVVEPGVEYFAYTDLMKCVERVAAGELPGL
jgi:hypothetical protein